MCHAEANAIDNFRGYKKEFEGARIYVDLFPCNECAKKIIQNGIKEVIYLSDKYKNLDERPSDKDASKIVTIDKFLNKSVISSVSKQKASRGCEGLSL